MIDHNQTKDISMTAHDEILTTEALLAGERLQTAGLSPEHVADKVEHVATSRYVRHVGLARQTREIGSIDVPGFNSSTSPKCRRTFWEGRDFHQRSAILGCLRALNRDRQSRSMTRVCLIPVVIVARSAKQRRTGPS